MIRTSMLLAGLAVLVGCRGGDHRDLPDRTPISGTVTYNGKSPVGAYVVLTPLPLRRADWQSVIPKGRVESDGSFRVQSFTTGDGASYGDYAVTVEWTGFLDPGKRPGPDRFKGRFGNPAKPLQTITVSQLPEKQELVLEPMKLSGPRITIKEQKQDRHGR